MSLFICSKCGAIENHSCLGGRTSEMLNNYPNMHLIEMHGQDRDDTYVLDTNGDKVLFKKAEDIMMLCSECNTGKWHNEFDKEIPSSDSEEVYISRYSKYNYITPTGTHHNGACIRNGDDYTLVTPLLRTFADWISIGYNEYHKTSENNITLMINNDIRIEWLLELLLHDVMNFQFTVIGKLFDNDNCSEMDGVEYLYQFKLFALDCLKDDSAENRENTIIHHLETFLNLKHREGITKDDILITFELFRNILRKKKIKDRGITIAGLSADIQSFINRQFGLMGNYGGYDDEMKDMINEYLHHGPKKVRKPHWKALQLEKDRNERLRKAEEKRVRKMERKSR